MITNENLYNRLSQLLRVYESSSDAKTRYKAEHEACRIANRLGFFGNEGALVTRLDNRDMLYILSTKKSGDSRIPDLQKVGLKSVKSAVVSPPLGYSGLSKEFMQYLGMKETPAQDKPLQEKSGEATSHRECDFTIDDETLYKLAAQGYERHLPLGEMERLLYEIHGRARGVCGEKNK